MAKTARAKIFTITYLLAITAALFPTLSYAAGIGEACARDADCTEGFCDAENDVCLPKHEEGGVCDRAAVCQAGLECRDGSCKPPAAAPPAAPPAPQPPAGEEQRGYQGINLGAPIPGLTRVTNLGDYIAGIYRYAIGIAGILAGVMITIGGVKWLTAAGNASIIESAKKTISGALVGLILVFGAYVILNTVNPELVKLRVPEIKTVERKELEFTVGEVGDLFGKPCFTIADAARCRASCTGCECVVQPPIFWAEFAETVNTMGPFLFAGVTEPQLVASAARAGLRVAWGGIKFLGRHPRTTVALGAVATFLAIDEAGKGERGLCLPVADHIIEPGGACDPRMGQRNCVRGSSCLQFSEYLGVCSKGQDGDYCVPPGEGGRLGPRGGCSEGYECVESVGGFFKCRGAAGGGASTPCEEDSDCTRGAGLSCVQTVTAGVKECRFKDYRDKEEAGLDCVRIGGNIDAQCSVPRGYHCILNDGGPGSIPRDLFRAAGSKQLSCRKGPGENCTDDKECMLSCVDGVCTRP